MCIRDRCTALFGLERDVLNGFYFSGRTAETVLFQVTVHVCHTSFADVQIRVLLVEVGIRQGSTFLRDSCFFLWTESTFVLLYQLSVAWAAGGCTSIHSDHDR